MKTLFLLLTLLLTVSLYSQIQVNNVREGYYQIFGEDGIKLQNGNKETLAEALQGLTNYQLQTGLKGYYIPPTFRVDIIGEDRVMRETEIDTLTISGHWHVAGDNGNYFRYINAGDIIKIKTDSVMKWQRDMEVIRTKIFGETVYEDTEIIPFQIREMELYDLTNVSAKIRVHITEKQSEIISYIDNVEYKRFTPGASEKINETDYWFWFNILQRQPNTSYKIRIEVISLTGAINFQEIILITLP